MKRWKSVIENAHAEVDSWPKWKKEAVAKDLCLCLCHEVLGGSIHQGERCVCNGGNGYAL